MSLQQPAALPVTTTGSWSRPGWSQITDDPVQRERFGPTDVNELFDDYALLAIQDQHAAGIDIVTDGEARRLGWIGGIMRKMPALQRQAPKRRLGPPGWDWLEGLELDRPLDELESMWDYVSEFEFLRRHTDRRPKIGMPGPLGLTTFLDFERVYGSRVECAEALVPAIRNDIKRLVAAGCDYIQIEEALTPGRAADNRTAMDMARLINQCVDGISGCTFIVHMCFGSYARLPYAKRTYAPFFPAMLDAHVQGFSIEFGSREMAEIELVGQWDAERILSAGLIDIKTHYAETPEDVMERVQACLQYRRPEQLEISTDCGLRQVPRTLALQKMTAAAEAARRLRQSG